jgi:phosphate transport system substrate-binding protein
MKRTFPLLAILALLAVPASAEDLAIIVAASVPLDAVTSEQLGRIFRCEETDGPNGTKLTVLNREKGCPERQLVLRKIYHMNDAAYNRFFMQAVFTGALAAPPQVVAGGAAMRRAAAANPGAVTYIRATQLDGTVKALKIDGLSPGDPDYPLKLSP